MSIRFLFLIGLLLITFLSCKNNKKDFRVGEYLYSIEDTSGGISRYGYRDSVGNVIVPLGKYEFNYTDTIKSIGFVSGWAIDRNGEKLFRTYPSANNGPDDVNEGVFRILGEDGTIGFANMDGKVIISPRFNYIDSFRDGFAEFCSTCPVGIYKTVQTETFRDAIQHLIRRHPNKIFLISGSKYGLINSTSDTIIKPEFEMISRTKESIIAYKEGRFFSFDYSGKEEPYDSVKHLSQLPNHKDFAARIIYVKSEDELLKLDSKF